MPASQFTPQVEDTSGVEQLSDIVEGVANKFFEEPGAIPAMSLSDDEMPSAKMGQQQRGRPAKTPFMGQPGTQTPLSSGLSNATMQNPYYNQQVKRRGLFAL